MQQNTIIQEKRMGLSFLEKNSVLRREDIKKYFYVSPKEENGWEYIHESFSFLMEKNFTLGIQYQEKKKTYYLLIGANSYFENPSELAFGSIEGERFFFLKETFGEEQSMEYLSFPREIGTISKQGLVEKRTPMTPENRKIVESCFQIGLESLEVFERQMTEWKEEKKNREKKIEKNPLR